VRERERKSKALGERGKEQCTDRIPQTNCRLAPPFYTNKILYTASPPPHSERLPSSFSFIVFFLSPCLSIETTTMTF
jgi:hypothetical protein